MREMEETQDKVIGAALNVTNSSNEDAVKLEEEACWVSALGADGDVGGQFD